MRAFALVTALLLPGAAAAQEFPAKTVRVVVPFPPGGATDILARAVYSPLCITVHPSVPAKNIRELIALARARPGEMTFASDSIVGGQRLAGEFFFREVAKTDIINVPYNGGAPAATAVMGGHSMILISNVTEVVQQLGAGRLRGIAVMSLARADQLPDMPTLSESGYPGFEAANWYGVVMRSATPRNVIERLSAEIDKALSLPEVKDSLHKFGLVPAYLNAAEFDAVILSELQRYARMVNALKLRMD